MSHGSRQVMAHSDGAMLERRSPIVSPLVQTEMSAEEAEWHAHRNYAVVVDAGSSGSRLMVYSWRDVEWERSVRTEKNLPLDILPTVEKGTWENSDREWQVKVEPGLSSFAGHTHDLQAYLEDLFSHVQAVVPPDAWSRTPIHVLATAGMRMVPVARRKAILQETCRVLRTLPFSVPDENDANTVDSDSVCGGQVRVISGEEEGLFGWIAINYLMDGFSTSSAEVPAGDIASKVGSTTYGFLDMGGASTQIAFEPSQEALATPTNGTEQASSPQQNDLFDVNFRRLDSSVVKHQVFVTTFLGFGTNAARTRYLDALAAGHEASTPLPDPCLPKNLRLVSDGAAVIGTGSFSECLALQQPLLDRDAECSHPPCLFHGVHVPAIDFKSNQFIGVSEYWYSSHDVFNLGGTYDYTTYQKAAQDFCAEEWPVLEAKLSQKHYKDQVTLSRLQMQCFKAAWVVTVLHEGLRLPRLGDANARLNATDHAQDVPEKANDKNLFQSVNDVRGLGVSWALGKAILEASTDIPAAPCASCGLTMQEPERGAFEAAMSLRPTTQLSDTPWLASILFLATCLGLAVLGYRFFVRRRSGAWTPLPTSDGSRRSEAWNDKMDDATHAVVIHDDDAWSDTPEASDGPSRPPRRHTRRKSHRKGIWSKVVHGTATYASRQLQRVVARDVLPTSLRADEPSGSRRPSAVRIVPHRLRDVQYEQLSRDGYPRVPAPWATALMSGSRSPTSPMTPVAPLSRPVSPHGRASRVASPHPERSASTPPARTRNAAVASGILYSSRPPSRGPSPMTLDTRRTSNSSAAAPSPSWLAPPDSRVRSPLDARMRSPTETVPRSPAGDSFAP